jgi:AcrR family transcriptional regulator
MAQAKHKTLRQRQHEATAEAMLDAAEQALLLHGYDKATMQQIASQTGCAAGTFYLYFKNKQVLFEAMVMRHVKSMHGAAYAAMEAVRSPLDKIRQASVSILEYWQAHHPFLRLMLTVWPVRHRAMKEHFSSLGWDGHVKFRRVMQSHLREAQRQGLIRKDLSAATLMDFLDSVGFSLVEAFTFSPGRLDARKQARILWGLVAGGIVHQE